MCSNKRVAVEARRREVDVVVTERVMKCPEPKASEPNAHTRGASPKRGLGCYFGISTAQRHSKKLVHFYWHIQKYAQTYTCSCHPGNIVAVSNFLSPTVAFLVLCHACLAKVHSVGGIQSSFRTAGKIRTFHGGYRVSRLFKFVSDVAFTL